MDNSYLNSISEAKKLLIKCALLSHANSTINLPTNYVGRLRELNYEQQWKTHHDLYWYHLKLPDQSLIFFKEDSYKYIMSPYAELLSRDLYEDEHVNHLIAAGYSREDALDLVSDSIQQDYQHYLDTEITFRHVTPIRIDIHPNQYQSTHHPVTHLHIGHDNDSRIPVKRIMTPFSFTGFVVATFYPEIWKELLLGSLLSEDEHSSMKKTLKSVPHIYTDKWCPRNEEERFYLS